MNGPFARLPCLSSEANRRLQRPMPTSKPKHVGPKQPKSPIKASKKIVNRASPRTRLRRASERRSKCMEGSAKLHGYFNKSKNSSSGDEVQISSGCDDGTPTKTASLRQVKRHFLDCEAECADSDSERSQTKTQEIDETMGGFIVSDGHLSSDEEDDDWGPLFRAGRIGVPNGGRVHTSKESEKEEESDDALSPRGCAEDMYWSPGAQPESPLSPILLDDTDEDITVHEEVEPPKDDEDPVEVEIPEPGEDLDTRDNLRRPFRCTAQYLLLTYKSHLPKQDYIAWFKTQVNRPDAWIRLAHETGDKKCPYNHTHVVVDLGKRPNIKNVHKFCYKNPNLAPDKVDKCGAIHPNVKTLNGTKALQDAKVYIAKEDPENKDLERSNNEEHAKGAKLVERIQNATSVNVALRGNLRKLSDAAGIIQIYSMRGLGQRNIEIPQKPDRPWALELLEQVENKECPKGDRKIIWYCDHEGNAGKTLLSKYLARTYNDESGFDWLLMGAMQDEKEANNQVVVASGQGFRFKGFILDLTRANKYRKKCYSYLEAFKNGQITSTKYQGGNVAWNTPWVIVMANFWPQVEELSKDRWDIRRINAQTYTAEHLHWSAEVPEQFKHCATCNCGQGHFGRHQILQEQTN